MFWGITLESGKKYTQVLQKSFCLTMAALGFENPSSDNVYVVAEVNKAQHVLCSLQSGKIPQQILNLNFTEGELVSFFIEGQGVVHLTGYLTLDDNDSETDSSDEDEKGEPKDDVLLQKQDVHNLISSYIHNNAVDNEKVSNLSWQGILSGSQEGNGDEIVTNRCNGDSKINMNGELCTVNQDSDNNSMLAEESKTNNTVINNGTFSNDDINTGSVISEHFSDDGIHENGLSNDEDTNRVGETSCNSSDEKSSMCSVESETRYLLVDNKSHKKNKRNANIEKTTTSRKKTVDRLNDDQGSPRRKKANIDTLKETQQEGSDNNTKTTKRKPPTKRTSKDTQLMKRNYSKTNSSKVKAASNKKTVSKRNSKLTQNKDSSIKGTPSKPSKQSSVRQGKVPSVKNQLRSERLRTMRKRKVNDKLDN